MTSGTIASEGEENEQASVRPWGSVRPLRQKPITSEQRERRRNSFFFLLNFQSHFLIELQIDLILVQNHSSQ